VDIAHDPEATIALPCQPPCRFVCRVSVALPRRSAHLGSVHRLLAIAVAGAVAVTSVAAAPSANCPAMRERVLKHCCCPPGPPEAARLTRCTQDGRVSASTSSPREQTERVQVAPLLVAIVFSHPSSDRAIALTAPTRESPAIAVGPPPVPLRV
jgi:hypothetical protein